MTQRAESSGIILTEADAAIIKGMLVRGDRQHDIAACFGVNGGRIAEIATGHRFSTVNPAASTELPAKGPYPRPYELLRELEGLKKNQVQMAKSYADSTHDL